MKLIIPAYFQPDLDAKASQWKRILRQYQKVWAVVIDPGAALNRPLEQCVGEFELMVSLLKDKGIGIFGRVDTASGARPQQDVLRESEILLDRYHLDGIALDAVLPSQSNFQYYFDLASKLDWRVLLKSGFLPEYGEYWNITSIFNTFEGVFQDYRRLFNSHYPHPHKNWHIVHSTPDPFQMRRCLVEAARKDVAYIYVTDGDSYDRLPSYWEQMMEFLT